jgi:hypothetical protein
MYLLVALNRLHCAQRELLLEYTMACNVEESAHSLICLMQLTTCSLDIKNNIGGTPNKTKQQK